MKHLFLLFLFYSLAGQAQFQISGIVKDPSGKPLPFASITAAKNDAITDVDGKFLLSTTAKFTSFTVSYIGFHKKTIEINDGKTYFTVTLDHQTDLLNQVDVANKDPALQIIRKTILLKNENDPVEKLKSFQFKSYNKMVITANPDSINGSIDSVFVRRKAALRFKKLDSSDYKFKNFISRQHLFQTEKVSEFQFADRHLKETVLGIKMSGFRQPIYEILALNLQSFSIYDNRYELFETKYKSPLSDDSFSDYNFKLLDTVPIENRKTYMIYFKNKSKRKAGGLEGALYIDAENFAVAKAIIRIRGIIDITATHDYTWLPSENIWFEKTKKFKVKKGKNQNNIQILGETLFFDSEGRENRKRQKFASDFTYVLSESSYFDFAYNIPVAVNNPFISVEILDDAENQTEVFWNRFRPDSLDSRSRQTYFALDSIVKKSRIEKRLFQGRKVLNGYVPFGYFDLDLRSLLSYNNYEGFRFGAGGKTNERFSRKFRIDGYSAYGTKDGTFKYSVGASARVAKFSGSWIGASYTDDLQEIGSASFAIDKRIFKIYDPRPINLSTFYSHQSWKLYFETKIIPKTESIWQLNYSSIEPKFFYVFYKDGRLYSEYKMTTAQVALQWNPFSDYMQTPYGRIEVEKRFPKFTFQYTQSLSGILGNDFNFGKIDFRTEYEKNYLNGQKTAVLIEAGYAYGDVPLTHLYNTAPNNLNRDRLLQRVTIAGKNAFETMFFNEFFSNKYIFLQFKQSSPRILLFKNIEPSFTFVTRTAFGDLNKKSQHIGFAYKTLEEGYFESGLEINQIYYGFGLAGFYRYGPNQLPGTEDNISVKVTFTFNLGF